MLTGSSHALVAAVAARAAPITDRELESAFSAAQQPGQHGAAVTRRARVRAMRLGAVRFKLSEVLHVAFPSDISCMMVFDQHCPLFKRDPPPGRLAGAPMHNLCFRSTLAVGKRARIGGIP